MVENNHISHISGDQNYTTYRIMEVDGGSYSESMIYKDESTILYLNEVSVSVGRRKEGLASKLITMHVELGMKLGCKYSCLQVQRSTWMLVWYLRIGYDYYTEDNNPGWVWLRKKLK